EDGAERLEPGDDVRVVHDLLADVDRGAVQLERPFDGLNRAVDAGAVPTWAREEHPAGTCGEGGHGPRVRGWPALAPRLHRAGMLAGDHHHDDCWEPTAMGLSRRAQ